MSTMWSVLHNFTIKNKWTWHQLIPPCPQIQCVIRLLHTPYTCIIQILLLSWSTWCYIWLNVSMTHWKCTRMMLNVVQVYVTGTQCLRARVLFHYIPVAYTCLGFGNVVIWNWTVLNASDRESWLCWASSLHILFLWFFILSSQRILNV